MWRAKAPSSQCNANLGVNGGSAKIWGRYIYKKIRLPHGTLISRLLLVEYLFCLYWKVTYEKVFCLLLYFYCWCCFLMSDFLRLAKKIHLLCWRAFISLLLCKGNNLFCTFNGFYNMFNNIFCRCIEDSGKIILEYNNYIGAIF